MNNLLLLESCSYYNWKVCFECLVLEKSGFDLEIERINSFVYFLTIQIMCDGKGLSSRENEYTLVIFQDCNDI